MNFETKGDTPTHGRDGWISLFNGVDLSGWRANVYPDSWTVQDGLIRARATEQSSHLFYVGDDDENGAAGRFRNFELVLDARSEPNANSGVFFHTDWSVSNARHHLAKGYEVQLNSSVIEKRKTGSLYAIVDLDESPVDEAEWFRLRLAVDGKRIVVRLNDKIVVDYLEPENPVREPNRVGRRLDPQGGFIALQGHDPDSVFYFKNVFARRLP